MIGPKVAAGCGVYATGVTLTSGVVDLERGSGSPKVAAGVDSVARLTAGGVVATGRHVTSSALAAQAHKPMAMPTPPSNLARIFAALLAAVGGRCPPSGAHPRQYYISSKPRM